MYAVDTVSPSRQDFVEDLSIGDRFPPLVVRNPQFLGGKDANNDPYDPQINHITVQIHLHKPTSNLHLRVDDVTELPTHSKGLLSE